MSEIIQISLDEMGAILIPAPIRERLHLSPGMTLVADRAEAVGLTQGLAFGVMNSAWALGNLTGPALGGALAERFGDAIPYLLAGMLCFLTLIAAQRVVRRPAARPAA